MGWSKSLQTLMFQRRLVALPIPFDLLSICTTSHRPALHILRAVSTRTTFNRTFTTNTSSPSATTESFYITTPIFYVNSAPHIGHLYTLILSDVFKRYYQLIGTPTVLATGVDEHGMKVQKAASSANMEPLEFCDRAATVFENLPQVASVSYDHFIRTTAPQHRIAVHHFWNVLQEKGFIYKGVHKGWYSVSDETFYPESAIETLVDPQTGQETKISVETGNLVEWTEEENYHFRLSAMQQPLLDFYAQNQNFLLPKVRYEDVIQAVKGGLQDLSISRPKSRLTWGIPVPGDDTQTIYVWLDALVNYLTTTGYPNSATSPGSTSGTSQSSDIIFGATGSPASSQTLPLPSWPADIHVIGKDILRFHCIYWPAFLLAATLPPPRQVLSHSHWTLNKSKISKSRGNVVDPIMSLDQFGIDPVRYYLMRDGRLEDDGDWDNESLVLRHNHELANGFGNLVARLTSPRFELSSILALPPLKTSYSPLAVAFEEKIEGCIRGHHNAMQARQVYKALAELVDLISHANSFLAKSAPWEKTCLPEIRRETLYLASEAARIALILLQPVLPTSAEAMLDRFGVSRDARGTRDAVIGADIMYRPVQGRGEHVFTPFVTGRIERKRLPDKRTYKKLLALQRDARL